MDGAKVVVIEDDENIREDVRDNLKFCGHTVTGEAATLTDALDLVDNIAEGQIEADVILLDGNLTHGTSHGEDARAISHRIKEKGVASKLIGFSILPMKQYSVQVDADSRKDIGKVISAIEAF